MSRGKPMGLRWLPLGLPMGLALASVSQVEAQRAAAGPPDWPCVQRLIPELAWGTLWTGPSLDELEQEWWEDEEIARVARFAISRSTPEEQALARVSEFVQSVDPSDAGAEQRLPQLLAGLYELTNRERRRTTDRIRGPSRAQMARLDTISEMVDELETQRSHADTAADQAEADRLAEALFWEQRTFQHRQQALPALCEQPYLLEEQLSRMVRVIMAHMP